MKAISVVLRYATVPAAFLVLATAARADEFMDARSWYGDLPPSQGGQYRITVSGTRGNATYDMFVGIAAAG